MRGIICAEVGRLESRDNLPEPERAAGDAIIAIRRIGICGTDMHAYRGNQPYFTYPRILGHELSGVIEAIEPNAAGLAAGDAVSIIPYLHCGSCVACRAGKTNCCAAMRVLGVHADGGMRERIAVPIANLLKAEGLTLDEAAVIEPLAIGAHAVRRAAVESGETVLVIGAGPIGLGVMAIAKQAGAYVIALDMNEERLAFARDWAGADETVKAADGTAERLAALTSGDFPTAVFDATGSSRSMAAAIDYVAHGGRLVYVGLVKDEIGFRHPDFHKRETTLMASRNATREDFEHVLRIMQSGVLDANKYITHRAPFDGMADVFEGWLDPAAKVVKAMVELG